MTFEKASHGTSLVYENAIFEDDDNDLQDLSEECMSPVEAETFVHQSTYDTMDLSYLQETKVTDYTGDEMTMPLSEGSSISRFPTFNFSLNTISSLSTIINAQKPGAAPTKVTLLLGVLEVEGPSYVKVKMGQYTGSEVALLKLIVGDERGAVCKMVAWRETAEQWSEIEDSGLKRGDITLFENVMISELPRRQAQLDDPGAKLQLTASPNIKSQAQVCYRTLPEPESYEDQKLRPDLRLADSVPAVRKVREVVIWMERMAGITVRPQNNS